MTVRVSVPATSANLGPGFDSVAAALSPRLVLNAERADEFSITTNIDVPSDRSNLLVQAFERVLPADGIRFTVESEIPLCGGLGSSACAVLAGILAAKALGGECNDPLALAIEVDGVADNSTAAYHGGVAVHVGGQVTNLTVPDSISGLVVVPQHSVHTEAARDVLPAEVPIADAVANAGYALLLGAGLASGDKELIAKGLHDQVHQRRRSALYPNSWELLGKVTELGAIGATISGSGSAVLVWVEDSAADAVRERLSDHAGEWATVMAVDFEPVGATVDGVPVA
ncbi:MAG: homoserine kinase [Solirubrobacterales bacterium]|nr:homoserine kinase [Solirubrobacterales bacterium]